MRFWNHALAAALLPAMPLVAFLKGNQYPLATPEAGLLLAACIAAGVLLGFIVFRFELLAALLFGAGAALCVDLMYGGGNLSGAALALGLALSLALAVALRRHIATVLAATASVFVAATLLVPGTIAQDSPRPAGAQTAAPQAARDLPVLVHLILDEHIGIDGLPAELPESAGLARALSDAYVSEGFRVHAGAYSEYFDTRNSIANLLNFSSERGDWAHLAAGKKKPYVLAESAYFRRLAGQGYRLRVYQSDYIDYCRVRDVPYAACARYRANSIASLPAASLTTLERAHFIFNSLVATSRYLERLREKYAKVRAALRGVALPAWGPAVSRVGPLAVLPVMKQLENDLRSASRGEAYFAHLLIPHYPYVLDEACSVRASIGQWLYNASPSASGELEPNSPASRIERYRNYFAQIRCQQHLLDRLFAAMKAAGVWRDAIVIIHGDHGSRIVRHAPVVQNAARLTAPDVNDAFSTLFVVKAPGLAAGVVHDPRPLQALLGEALGMPPAPDARKVYLRTEDEARFVPLRLPVSRAQGAAD
jgi:hypothetical protein